MSERRTFRSGLVLLELLAAITLFSLAGAVCLRVLVKADDLTRESARLEQGISAVSSAAEIIRSADSEEEAAALLALGELPGDGSLSVELRHDGGCTVYELDWVWEENTVYSLELWRYFGEVAP